MTTENHTASNSDARKRNAEKNQPETPLLCPICARVVVAEEDEDE